MIKYQVVEDHHDIPGWRYALERIADHKQPVRILFNGTKREAEAEAVKLNALVPLS
jgi:hypothetical protein